LNDFSIKYKDPYRAFFETLLPKIISLIDINKECSYRELLVYLLEKIAEEIEINRFKIYSFEELHKKVKKNYNKKDNHLKNKLPNFFQASGFLPKKLKKELIIEIAEEFFLKN